MSFIVGSIVIGAGASIVGGAIAAKGSKRAAEIAAGGADAEIAFNRESRDLARADQEPYQKAGTTALTALMDMVGLPMGAPSRTQTTRSQTPTQRGPGARRNDNADPVAWSRGSSYGGGSPYDGTDGYNDNYGRALGGPLYNVNELGPENIYDHGSYTRSSNPKTVPPSRTGYVGRNSGGYIGRDYGGNLNSGDGDPVGWGGPRIIPGGTSTGTTYGEGPPPPDKYGNADYINSNWPVKNPGDATGTVPAPYDASGSSGNVQVMPAQSTITDGGSGVTGSDFDSSKYDFRTDPGYEFRFDEGQRALERGAGARGGLLSGGYGRKAMRYGQEFASNEYTNVYNRIANIAGLGQVAAQSSGAYAINAGSAMGNAANQGAMSSAYGSQGATNAWANTANQIGQLPWGSIFNKGNPQGSDGYPGAFGT